METFPRQGVELSSDGEILFEEPQLVRPAIVYHAENGYRSARARTATSRWDFVVHFKVPSADWETIVAFLDARALTVESFIIHHPYLAGSEGAVANYALDKLPTPRIIRGATHWFGFSLPMIGQF
jgi:hypothetical protein